MTMSEKHRDQLHDAIEWLAREVNPRDPWAPLEVRAAMGIRNPRTDEVTLHIRVHDPAGRLRGAGIEGLVQLGPSSYSFDRREVAEHLATLLAQDAIDLSMSGGPPERTDTPTGSRSDPDAVSGAPRPGKISGASRKTSGS